MLTDHRSMRWTSYFSPIGESDGAGEELMNNSSIRRAKSASHLFAASWQFVTVAKLQKTPAAQPWT
jgi:hypothetical protein